MSKDLTQGRPFRVLLQFSLPVIAGNLFQLFYTLADTVIVGRTLGAQALAAVGSTTIVIYFVLCFAQGFTGGVGFLLAIVLFASVRERLDCTAECPRAFEGFPIALISAGLIALAFMGFSGLKI